MADHQPFAGMAQEETLQGASGILCILAKLLQKLRVPTGFDLAQNRQRVTAAVESGTVTTVTTVANLTNIGGYPGSILVQADLRNAWGNTVARRFS